MGIVISSKLFTALFERARGTIFFVAKCNPKGCSTDADRSPFPTNMQKNMYAAALTYVSAKCNKVGERSLS